MDNDTTAPHTTRMPCFTTQHITEAPHTTKTTCNITKVPQTEGSPGYTQCVHNFKQHHES